MKRNIVIAAVTAAALLGGGAATALATSGDDDPGTARRADDGANGREGDGGARVTPVGVTAADAVASALREAPGTAVSAELDDGDGDDGERTAWEVDVLAGDGTRHSVRVHPGTGEVLGSETDDEDGTAEVRAALKGTSVDAADAAKAAAGHGTVISVELDEDGHYGDGRTAWEVETRASGEAERDWRVDPRSGEVTADRSHGPHSGEADDSDDSDDSDTEASGPDDD